MWYRIVIRRPQRPHTDIPPHRWHQHRTPAATLTVLRTTSSSTPPPGQSAAALTARDLRDGAGRPFTSDRVRYHCSHYKIPTRAERLRAKGLLSLSATATRFGVHPHTVKRWRELGLLTAEQSSDAPAYMFHPDQPRPSLTQVWTAESADRQGTPSQHAQLRAVGLLTQDETAAQHGVTTVTIIHWRKLALLTAEQTDLTGRWLYHPHQPTPTRAQVLTAAQAATTPPARA